MLFRLLLASLGIALSLASRMSGRVAGQLSRDMTIVLWSKNIARAFIIKNRKISSTTSIPAEAKLKVGFSTPMVGVRIFLASNTIDQIVDGFGNGEVICEGEAAHLLWFYQLAVGLLPGHINKQEHWPDSYTEPNYEHKASDRIIREPALEMLDPACTDAHLQREKTILWQVGRGRTPWGKVVDHQIVVDLDSQDESPDEPQTENQK